MAGENYEDWSLTEVPRIRENFPTWIVEVFDDGDAAITCSGREGRCGNTAIVNYEKWKTGAHLAGSTKTRPCPYCFRASRVPNEL